MTANNHPGVVSISGTPTQNQTLTATVSDADGVPASVTYQWQQSANGTTWSNINGATASTLTLAQAQVGSFVRARATYTDSLGSSETPVSVATVTTVANVNDAGAVAINGTATQNQILTASVADIDGVPAGITYRWQSSTDGTTWVDLAGDNVAVSPSTAVSSATASGRMPPTPICSARAKARRAQHGVPATISYLWQSSADGTTWTNLAATASSLTLDSSLVGKRVRANAAYTDLLGTTETATSAATAPVAAERRPHEPLHHPDARSTELHRRARVDWEIGMRFTSDNPGLIQAIRYYKSPSETGTHVGHIWSSTGQAAGDRHVHQRRRLGLAAADARDAADHQCRHDLRRLGQLPTATTP